MSKQLFVITKNWDRHGKFSGYEKLVSYLKVKFKVQKGFFLPYRIIKHLAHKIQLTNYKSENVTREWSILLKVFKSKTIVVLYGDMDYYYLHLIKRFPFNLRKNKLVAVFHHPPYELEKRLNYNRKKILGALDKVIVMGSHQIPFLKQYTNAKFEFIPHGINTDFFVGDPSKTRLNQILLIGVSHRDHDRNIKIINAVNERIQINFIVIILGQFAHLYKGLNNVTIVTKNISDSELLEYYQTSKGLLLSLRDCTASNTILEALATGCPLITNNVGAVKEYIPEGSGIPVFENEEIAKSADYIIALITDSAYLNEISSLQRQLAEQYNWHMVAKRTENFING